VESEESIAVDTVMTSVGKMDTNRMTPNGGRMEMAMPKYEDGEFSVAQFFSEDNYEYVRRFVSAEEAVKAARHYITSVAARTGMVKRVIITDGGDCTNFEWIYGKGIVYPTQEELNEDATNTN
jgi:hypothetical protein